LYAFGLFHKEHNGSASLRFLLNEDQHGDIIASVKDKSGSTGDKAKERVQAISWMAAAMEISPYFFDGVFKISRITPVQLPSLESDSDDHTQPGASETLSKFGICIIRLPFHLHSSSFLDGVYPVFTNLKGFTTAVWFSHLLGDDDYSLYAVNNCTQEKMLELERFLNQSALIPFLGVDCLLLNDYRVFNKEVRDLFGEANEAVRPTLNAEGTSLTFP
jgi:hypothetical protein